jgi:ribosomal-protein-alanine acetyltransferase
LRIRDFEREDRWVVVAIQAKSPETAQWLEADYVRLSQDPGGLVLVAELETTMPPKVVGFAAFHRVINEAELRNMAVDPEHRDQGAGKMLLDEGRTRLLEAGAKRVFLEVRPSNKAALGLYYSVGFGLYSNRKDYYRDPQEDAYILCMELFPPTVIPTMR